MQRQVNCMHMASEMTPTSAGKGRHCNHSSPEHQIASKACSSSGESNVRYQQRAKAGMQRSVGGCVTAGQAPADLWVKGREHNGPAAVGGHCLDCLQYWCHHPLNFLRRRHSQLWWSGHLHLYVKAHALVHTLQVMVQNSHDSFMQKWKQCCARDTQTAAPTRLCSV